MQKLLFVLVLILFLGFSEPPTTPQAPEEPEWNTTEWSKCLDTCEESEQTRTATCMLAGETVDESWCQEQQPNLTQTCEMFCDDVPDTQGTWNVSEWSECSVSCGGGIQTRTAHCELGEVIIEREAVCQEQQPNLTQTCNLHTCNQATLTIQSEVKTNITITYQNTTKKNYSTPTTLRQNTPIIASITLTNNTTQWFSHWKGNCQETNTSTCTVNISIGNETTITAIQNIYTCTGDKPRGEATYLGQDNSTKQQEWEYTNTNPGVCEWTCKPGYTKQKNTCEKTRSSSGGGGGSNYGISSNPILDSQSTQENTTTQTQNTTKKTSSTNKNQQTSDEQTQEETQNEEETTTTTNTNQQDALTENQQEPREEQPAQATSTGNPWILLTTILTLLVIATAGTITYKNQHKQPAQETPIQQYVRINLKKGFSKEQIRQKLLAAGYKQEEVKKLLEK